MNSPWLCNLDWNAKIFRGKAIKTTKASKALVADLEAYYQKEDGDNQETGDGKNEEYKFLISCFDDTKSIHMPNYPESVLEYRYYWCFFILLTICFPSLVPCVGGIVHFA